MDWYKMYHGLPTDARLTVVARRADTVPALALALWVTLLDQASRAQPRGYITRVDTEELAVTLGLEPVSVEKMLAAFYAKNMVDSDGGIADWHEKQNTSTARVKAWRARQKEQLEMEGNDA